MSDFTHLLERLEAFEEQAGVRLEALYAHNNHNYGRTIDGKFVPSGMIVNGELHARSGTKLARSVVLVTDAYDSSGRLVGTTSGSGIFQGMRFDHRTFLGFQTFSFRVGDAVSSSQIAKIRIYPKPVP